MADRRMFSKVVVESDVFLDMPITARALYFHLGMQADDDGFINSPKKVQRMVGCSDDDLKLLIAKRFLIPFETGVVLVRHWKQNNQIRADRYKPTVCQEEIAMVSIGKSGEYEFGIPTDNQLTTKWQPTDNQLTTKWQPSIGKGSIEQLSIGEGVGCGDSQSNEINPNTVEAYASNNLHNLSSGNMEMLGSFMDDLPDDVIRYGIDVACGNGKPYWNYVAAILQAWVDAGVKTVGDAKAEREKKPKTAPKPQTKGDMNYTQHDYTSSDYDWMKGNEDLEKLYGGGT